MRRLNEQGYGLVELSIAVLILGIFAQSLVLARVVMARKTVALLDRGYAAGKALQMFNELQSSANQASSAAVLDFYSDGSQANAVLTTDKAVDSPGGDPADPLSGNRLANGHWRYLRQVQVSLINGNPQARQVTIQVWKYATDENPLVPGLLLATQTGIVQAATP